jgi:dTDP-4-amino-4,6-dideoxygalactose transaminase
MIRMNDLGRLPQGQREAELAAMQAVLASGQWILGERLAAFERSWAHACGGGQCVGVANGQDALEIALRGLGIGLGD